MSLLRRLLPCGTQGRIAYSRLLLGILRYYGRIIDSVTHIVAACILRSLRPTAAAAPCSRVAHGCYHDILYILID